MIALSGAAVLAATVALGVTAGPVTPAPTPYLTVGSQSRHSDGSPAHPAAAVPPVGTGTPTMVVLDASGSMRATDVAPSRIIAAKRAVTGLVASLPAYARVGLEVYGSSTGSGPAERRAGCRDVRVLAPVARVDRGGLEARVSAVRASGYTPIGAALQRAVAALPTTGPRAIVLVSDGEDTCAPPDPCTVARRLHAQGIDLAIHTVGLRVGSRARTQLQCIAAATGGVYRDAEDASSLSTQLYSQVSRALRGYRTRGTPVQGSANAGDGPTLKPGQYVDTLDAVDPVSHLRTAYYSITPPAGSTPYVAATVVPPARRLRGGGVLSVQVTIRRLESPPCSISDRNSDIGVFSTVGTTTALATPRTASDRACLTGGPLVVEVTRDGTAFGGEPMKVELAYRVESPADADGLPDAASPRGELVPDVSGRSTALESGTSFNDAPLVNPGVYRDSFVSGEARYVRVHLNWGERLAFTLTTTAVPGVTISHGVAGRLFVANAVRGRADLTSGSYASNAFLGWSQSSLSGSTPVPVRWTNRRSTQDRVRQYSLAGDYYLVLATSFPGPGRPALTVPYTLRMSVLGRAERGPVYLPAGTTPRDPSPPPISTGPSASPVPSGPRATSVTGRTARPGRTVSAVAHSETTGRWGRTPMVLGLAVAVLLAAAGLGLALARRRRPGTTGGQAGGYRQAGGWGDR